MLRSLRAWVGAFCAIGLINAAAHAQVRVFMAPDSTEQDQPSTGPTFLTLSPGETIRVMVWSEDTDPKQPLTINGYQILIPWYPEPLEGTTGSIFYVDNNPGDPGGDSAFIDFTRRDWFFDGMPEQPYTNYNETPSPGLFGVLYTTVIAVGIDPSGQGVRYLMEFEFAASPDACGTFEARFQVEPDPPWSSFFSPFGEFVPVDVYQSMIIQVANCEGEPCAGPCDDLDACTVDDTCIDDVCAGVPVDCSVAGGECWEADCDPAGPNGNCHLLTPINEGHLCANGQGVCEAGVCYVRHEAERARVFMARPGEQGAQPPEGPTSLAMIAGETATVGAWLEDSDPAQEDLVNAYQILVAMAPQPLDGATGSIEYVDNKPGDSGGDSIWIDVDRKDWLFSPGIVLPINYTEHPDCTYMGVFYATIPGTGIDPSGAGIRYLVQFDYQASPEACGDFEARFRLQPKSPPLSMLFTMFGALIDIDEFQPLIITVGDCTGEPCAEPCSDGDVCTVNDVCDGAACVGEPVDCSGESTGCRQSYCEPAGCSANCSAWTPINEGLPCDGGSGVCEAGTCVAVEPEMVHVFMAPEGLQEFFADHGPLPLSIPPGETMRLKVWLRDREPGELLKRYFLRLPYWADPHDGSAGGVSYVDNEPGEAPGDSILIDPRREDWVFANTDGWTIHYDESNGQDDFLAFADLPKGTAVDPAVVDRSHYLCEFDIVVTPDASGSFELSFFVPPGANSALINDTGDLIQNVDFIPLTLEVGAPFPMFSEPPDGATDPTGGGDPAVDPGGVEAFVLYLNGPADGLMTADFDISVTHGDAPIFEDIVSDGSVATLRFDRPIPAGECTTITHVASGWAASLASLPGDVNADGVSNTGDVVTLVDHLSAALDSPLESWQCDIDRSGACNGLDVLALIDLLNGAGGAIAWNGVERPACP